MSHSTRRAFCCTRPGVRTKSPNLARRSAVTSQLLAGVACGYFKPVVACRIQSTMASKR